MKRWLVILGASGLIALLILAWQNYRYTYTEMASYGEIAGKRYELAKTAESIKIAVVWPQTRGDEANNLWNGIRQAQAEINNRENPLEDENGRPFQGHDGKPYYHRHPVGAYQVEQGRPVCRGLPIRVRTGFENGAQIWEVRCMKIDLHRITPRSNTDELDAAGQISRDPQFVAVIGHSSNDVAKFAAVSYQQTDLLFLSVNVTDPSLTNHNFKYVFRTIPNEYEMSAAVVKMLGELRRCHGISGEHRLRIGVFYARSASTLAAVSIITITMRDLGQGGQYAFEKS